MRTPGADFELAAGFLYGEGLINTRGDIREVRYCVDPAVDGTQRYNIVNVFLARGVPFDPSALQRNFYTTSSCGVCGKASIEAVRATATRPAIPGEPANSARPAIPGEPAAGSQPVAGVHPETEARPSTSGTPAHRARQAGPTIRADLLLDMPARLRERQSVFDRTGGLHAAALFAPGGELRALREDVGRHNAMDKLVGSMLLEGTLPGADGVVIVSGRLSFELVQKAARAGVRILAGISAPSTLAVELAEDNDMTLVGFLRESRFNIYAGGERIDHQRSIEAAHAS